MRPHTTARDLIPLLYMRRTSLGVTVQSTPYAASCVGASAGTHFTRFTGARVQRLTRSACAYERANTGAYRMAVAAA